MSEQQENGQSTRREFLANLSMWVGLATAYGVLGIQGLLFLLPKQFGVRTRKLFAGTIDHYQQGSVQSFYDLQGNELLVKREAERFQAFSTICPHLGCRVHWEADNQRFFCPCHRGVFDPNGVAIEGPPKEGGQNLPQIPVTVDEDSGVVYLEVKDA